MYRIPRDLQLVHQWQMDLSMKVSIDTSEQIMILVLDKVDNLVDDLFLYLIMEMNLLLNEYGFGVSTIFYQQMLTRFFYGFSFLERDVFPGPKK